jgi:hypothetical protein
MKTQRSRRAILSAALAAATLSVCTLVPGHALASYGACRSDPALVLSNGAVLDLSASIGTDLSNVASVTYAVHLPVGVRALAVVNTDGLMGIKEHFVAYADDSANTYDGYTMVQTVSGSASVTANETVVSLASIGSPNVTGVSGQAVHTRVTVLFRM